MLIGRKKFQDIVRPQILVIVLLVVLVRFIAVFTMGLMPQDAYYYYYSQNLALSYFDHPPMIALMLNIFTGVFGRHAFVLKSFDFLITGISLIAFYRLSTYFLSQRKSTYAVLMLGSTLMVTILSLNSTPDVPLILFWILSLIFLYKAIFQNASQHWAIAGVCMGLAFDSKYTGLFLLGGLVVFLIFSFKYRKLLVSKNLYLLLACFIITILPVLIWNFQNDFISFKFHANNHIDTSALTAIKPLYFIGTFGHQLLLLIPVFFISAIIITWKVLRKYIKRWPVNDQHLFLLAFSLPLLFLFFGLSTISWVKINWMMPAYITLAILVAAFIKEKHVYLQLLFSAVLHIALFVQLIFYPVNIKSDDTWWGWLELSKKVDIIHQKYPGHFIFSADGYKTSSILNFYENQHIYSGNVIGENGLQYSLLDTNLNQLAGRNAIFLDSDPALGISGKLNPDTDKLKKYFSEIHELPSIILNDEYERTLRKFLVFECKSYKPDR
jgi:4-amino-4-deoxy-L-arabinose transferase-like glycosyltransferase